MIRVSGPVIREDFWQKLKKIYGKASFDKNLLSFSLLYAKIVNTKLSFYALKVMKLNRHLDDSIQQHFKKYKEILVLLGSRQSGKTTLLKRLFPDAQYLLVDNEPVRKALESFDVNTYKSLLRSDGGIVVIDEIHLLSNPGRAAKIIYDQLPHRLIITGSSSLQIKHASSESLAGRKIEYVLFPLTFSEFLFQNDVESELRNGFFEDVVKGERRTPEICLFDLKAMLHQVLLYGLYPAMVNHPHDRVYLENFVDSLIFKDLFELQLIENKRVAQNLLKLLAYQIGSLVNYSELATRLQVDQRTVKRYIEVFEQSFVLFRLYPFVGNRRQEIVKTPKIYFYDTGIRNALIGDFTDIDLRPDSGALFENFIIVECMKANRYLNAGFTLHYWRTKQNAEVDLVLSSGKDIIGVEIKTTKGSFSKAFTSRYPHARCHVITMENFY